MRTQSPELHLLTGVYALGALADDERAGVEAHLADCPSCAEEVRGLRETAARLAMATAVTPPPEMRARLLATVSQARQLPPPGHRRRAGSGARTWRQRVTLVRAGATTGVLGLAAALVFLLVSQVSTSDQLHQAQQGNRAVAAVLAAPDARFESLPTTAGGTVTAVTSLRHQEAVVTSAHLPALSGGRVYQLWIVSAAGAARSAGLLDVTVPGSAAPVLADGVAAGDHLAITVEPAGGAAQPTTAPVVLMPVTA